MAAAMVARFHQLFAISSIVRQDRQVSLFDRLTEGDFAYCGVGEGRWLLARLGEVPVHLL